MKVSEHGWDNVDTKYTYLWPTSGGIGGKEAMCWVGEEEEEEDDGQHR